MMLFCVLFVCILCFDFLLIWYYPFILCWVFWVAVNADIGFTCQHEVDTPTCLASDPKIKCDNLKNHWENAWYDFNFSGVACWMEATKPDFSPPRLLCKTKSFRQRQKQVKKKKELISGKVFLVSCFIGRNTWQFSLKQALNRMGL